MIERVVWAALLGLTLASIALPPTALLWHGGDVPDGNSFRQAWVVAGIVTVSDLLDFIARKPLRVPKKREAEKRRAAKTGAWDEE